MEGTGASIIKKFSTYDNGRLMRIHFSPKLCLPSLLKQLC